MCTSSNTFQFHSECHFVDRLIMEVQLHYSNSAYWQSVKKPYQYIPRTISTLTWLHLFLCLIFSLSLTWVMILLPPGIVHSRRPPYGVGNFWHSSIAMFVSWTALEAEIPIMCHWVILNNNWVLWPIGIISIAERSLLNFETNHYIGTPWLNT